jgi:hypothetical protein
VTPGRCVTGVGIMIWEYPIPGERFPVPGARQVDGATNARQYRDTQTGDDDAPRSLVRKACSRLNRRPEKGLTPHPEASMMVQDIGGPTVFDLHPWLAPVAVAAVVVAVLLAVVFTRYARFIWNPREPSKQSPRATTAPPSNANSQPLCGQGEEGIGSSATGRSSTERPPGSNSSSSPWGPIVTPPPRRITVDCPSCGGHLAAGINASRAPAAAHRREHAQATSEGEGR